MESEITESELGEKIFPTDDMYHPPSKLRKPISEEKARKVKMSKIIVPHERPLDVTLHYPSRDWIEIALPNKIVESRNQPRRHFFKIIDMLGESRGRGTVTEEHVKQLDPVKFQKTLDRIERLWRQHVEDRMHWDKNNPFAKQLEEYESYHDYRIRNHKDPSVQYHPGKR